jgi:hypothetical protein
LQASSYTKQALKIACRQAPTQNHLHKTCQFKIAAEQAVASLVLAEVANFLKDAMTRSFISAR